MSTVSGVRTKPLWPLLTAYSVAYTFFLTAPAIFHHEFPLQTDMEWGDVLDIPTPLVVFGFVWVLLRRTLGKLDVTVMLALFFIALVWTQGQGMHLASNSISHHVDAGTGGSLADIVDFYDEKLSHYIWYLGVFMLPIYLLLMMRRDRDLASGERPYLALPAALLYGLVMGVNATEAAVVPMALPMLVLAVLIAGYLYRSERRLRGVELFAFTGLSVLAGLAELLAWGAYYGGWPELSDVGLI